MRGQATSRSAVFSPVSARAVDEVTKRAFDIVAATLLIFLLIPLFIGIYAAVRLTSGGGVIFSQARVGHKGRLFSCFKFRTMVPDAATVLARCLAEDPEARQEWEQQQKLKHDPRVTRVGQFLRKSSLDELPQLFNVLVGDMSLVGPRPIVPDETVRYGENLIYYLAVKPGMTGLWQVSGRSDTSYGQRVLLDTKYAEERTIGLDISILLSTVSVLINQRGSY